MHTILILFLYHYSIFANTVALIMTYYLQLGKVWFQNFCRLKTLFYVIIL